MNTQRVRNALYTFLHHPEQLSPGSDTDLQLALHSDNPLEQGLVMEMLREAILYKMNGGQ